MAEFKQSLEFDASRAIQTLAKLSGSLNKVSKALNKFSTSANKTSGASQKASAGISKLGKTAQYAAGVLGGQLAFRAVSALIGGFQDAVAEAKNLSIAIGEIQTIGEGTIGSMAQVTEQVLQLSSAMGVDTASVAEGYYQTLSNQVVETGEAYEFLGTAQKLATTTMASTTDAVNALSSVMNSYGDSAGSAAEISDKLFTIVKEGRVRLGNIGNVLGNVTPLAAKLGISFDEVGAALITMTKQGVKENVALTQMRGVMTKLVKPTEELQDLFHKWGVEDGQQAIATFGGLEGVLRKISEETGGSAARMGEFFNRVRALVGVLSIGTQGGEEFTGALENMQNAAGRLETALKTLNEAPGRQLQIRVQQLKNQFVALATQALPAITLLTAGVSKLFSILGIGNDALESQENAYKRVTKEQKKLAEARELSEWVEETKKGFEEARQAAAAYQRAINQFQFKVDIATDENLAAFDTLAGGLSSTLDTIQQKLDNFANKSLTAAKKAWKDAEAVADNYKKFEDKLEVAKAPKDKQLEVRFRQLREDTEAAFRELGRTQWGTAEFEKASSVIQTNIGEMGQLSLQAVDTSSRKSAEIASKMKGYSKSLEGVLKTHSQSMKSVGEAAKSPAGQRALADIAKNISGNIKVLDEARKKLAEQGADGLGDDDLKTARTAFQELLSSFEQLTPEQTNFINKILPENALGDKLRAELDRVKKDGLNIFDESVENLQKTMKQVKLEAVLTLSEEGRANLIAAAEKAGIDLGEAFAEGGLQGFLDKLPTGKELSDKLTQTETAQVEQEVTLRNSQKYYEERLRIEKELAQLEKLETRFNALGATEAFAAGTVAATSGTDIDSEAVDAAKVLQESYKELQVIAREGLESGNLNAERATEVLQKVKEAFETGYFHGDMADPFLEMHERLQDIKTAQDEAREASDETAEATKKISENSKSAKTATDGLKTAMSDTNTAAGNVKTTMDGYVPSINNAVAAMGRLKAAADQALAAANQAIAASSQAGASSTARYGKYFAAGGSARGVDNINAMLSPGEFVVNAGSARKFYSELVALNSGQKPAYREQGGSVTNVGDINVSVQGQETPRQTIREIASGLRRELKRGTITL